MARDDLIDPFDEPYADTDGVYAQPAIVDNNGLIDPFDEPEQPPVDTGALSQPQYTQPTTGTRAMADIVNERSAGTKIKEAITGGEQRTKEIEMYPTLFGGEITSGAKQVLRSLTQGLAFEPSPGDPGGLLSDVPFADIMKIGPALMTTFDPAEQSAIIRNTAPHISEQLDEQGNIILVNTNTGARRALGRPGLDTGDILQGTAVAAEYYPAAAAGAGKQLLNRMARVGAGTAGTEAINQALQQQAGGTFDPADVGIAGLAGAGFEGVATIVSKALAPVYMRNREITPDIRKAFYESAREAGIDPNTLTDDVIQSYLESATVATRAQPRGEFDIRYTAGQRTGDKGLLGEEEFMRSRAAPTKARAQMEDFAEQQRGDIMSARERITGEMGAGEPIQQPIEGAERVIEGVKERGQFARRGVEEAYEDVGQAGVLPAGQRGLVQHLQRVAKVEDFDQSLKETGKAMGQIREAAQFIDDAGKQLPPTTLNKMEFYRRKILRGIEAAENNADRAQMIQIRKAYDDYMARAIDRGLMTGDPETLQNILKARGLHSAYMKTYTKQDERLPRTGRKIPDRAGDLIERMVDLDPEPEEVINFIFGASKLVGKKDAAKAVEKIKDIVGPESEEFASLRQAAFLRLTDPGANEVFSGQKMLTALKDAIKKRPTLMNSLFSNDEQAMMLRFAREVKKAQPDPLAPSGTPYGNAQILTMLTNKLLSAMAFATGGTPGMVAAEGGKMAAKQFGSWRAKAAAQAATSQMRPLARIPAAVAVPPATQAAEAVTDQFSEDIAAGRAGGAL